MLNWHKGSLFVCFVPSDITVQMGLKIAEMVKWMF